MNPVLLIMTGQFDACETETSDAEWGLALLDLNIALGRAYFGHVVDPPTGRVLATRTLRQRMAIN